MEEKRYLIVGLGNPRKDYEKTRHNIGERIARSFAKKHGWVFKKESSLKGDIAKGNIKEKSVIVFLPVTYMNESGIAVKRAFDYFRIAIEDMLVLVDDADILFGEFRLKDNSSTGGHRGLQSIEDHLQTNRYPRLRIGIGRGTSEELCVHVLGRFSEKEKVDLPNITRQAINIIEMWLFEGITLTMNVANVRSVSKTRGEK